MAIKFKQAILNYPVLFLTIIIFFILGAVSTYYLISNTLIIPIDYSTKLLQIANSEKQARTKVYIDYFNNFYISYPSLYFPSPKPGLDDQASAGVDFKDIQSDKTFISIYIQKPISGEKPINNIPLIQIMKNSIISDFSRLHYEFPDIDPKIYTNNWKFTETKIGGHNAITATYEVDQNMHNLMPDYLQELDHRAGGNLAPLGKIINPYKFPVGYKSKRVVILYGNNIFLIKSETNIGDIEVEEKFDNFVNSLKFLY